MNQLSSLIGTTTSRGQAMSPLSNSASTGIPNEVAVPSILSDGIGYRDFSRASVSSGGAIQGKDITFPVKLHMILSNPEYQDIISWLPHGRSWRILQQKTFEEQVLPVHFKHGRYSSFARQVNGWGFRRVTKGGDYNSYYHEMFLRGMPQLCKKMKRLTLKEKEENETATPDFYLLSRKNPIPESSTGVELIAPTAPQPTQSNNFVSVSEQTKEMIQAELALLEQRRRQILEQMRAVALAGVFPAQDPVALPTQRTYWNL